MGGWLTSLAEWCRQPVRGGFAELDMQIDKLRVLRDSYRIPYQDPRYDETSEVTKGVDSRACK